MHGRFQVVDLITGYEFSGRWMNGMNYGGCKVVDLITGYEFNGR